MKIVWQGEAKGYETIITRTPEGEYEVWYRHAIHSSLPDAERAVGVTRAAREYVEEGRRRTR